jgi:hypothetical protein
MIDEFKTIPSARDSLGASLTVVTADDSNELRKLVKKRKIDWCVVLSDPEKRLIEMVRCHATDKLLSVLLILDTKTGSVLGIWYEGCKEWEAGATGEFVVERIQHLRASATGP